MNKKLLGLLMAGILATTSLSSLTAFAATSNVASTKKTNTIESATKASSIWFSATALPGAELYSQPYSDCYSWTVQQQTSVSVQVYGNGWYKVKFSDGSIYYSWEMQDIEE